MVYASMCYSCKTGIEGNIFDNAAPDTHTIIDTIVRSGSDRLESQVTLNWWGDDADGFIEGYEYTFDEVITDATVWSYIQSQDSTFILSTPAGQDTANYYFSIRAIDNDGLRDASPAHLIIPVKNSPPTVLIIPGLNNPKKSFPVLKFYWNGNDPDGLENLSYFEVFFNDTTATPYILDKLVSSAIFEAQNPASDDFICNVYSNASLVPNAETITGLHANAWNTLYIRAVDESNEKSAFALSDSVYVKKVSSDILMVDGYSTTSNESFYASRLINNGFAVFDTIQLFENIAGAYTQQSADNITQGKIFDLFKCIIWYSNDANNSFSLAQKTTENFFNSGGKMLMSVYISSSFDPLSNFLDFTPVASLVNAIDTTLILDLDAQLNPVDITYPVLQTTSIIGIVKPINLQIGSDPLYTATLTAKDNITLMLTPWLGTSTVIAKKYDASGNTNFILSTLELHKMNGLLTIDDFFQKVLEDEFGL